MALKEQMQDIYSIARSTCNAVYTLSPDHVRLGPLANAIVACPELLNQIKALLVGEDLADQAIESGFAGDPGAPITIAGQLNLRSLGVTVSKIETASARLRHLINLAVLEEPLPISCWEESFDALHKITASLPKRCPTVELDQEFQLGKPYSDPANDLALSYDFTAAPGYEQLAQVFAAAHDQAAYGKGKERHANGLPFHEQRMQGISDLVGSPDGMVYQLVKKTTEGLQFDEPEKREHELLGALNYLAGIVIWLRRHETAKPVEG